ncbi:MAG: hypothetical protein ACR2KQ_01365 [Actinomycetota bacterium]
MTFRPLRAYRALSASLNEMDEANAAAEQRERLALARSTTQFCRKSKQVVDDTMSLSAVLMRAGEVDEAQRLLAEVDRDVEQEKVALLEVMNEVSQKKAERSHKVTRLRLAKMLMSAVLGASLMTFSAFGVALANYFSDRVAASEGVGRAAAEPDPANGVSLALRHVELAPGVRFKLTAKQYEEYARLTSKKGNSQKLQTFLRDVLPPGMLDKVTSLLANKDVGGTVKSASETVKAAAKKAAGSAPAQPAEGSGSSGNDDESTGPGSSSDKEEKDEQDPSEGGSSKKDCEDEPKEGGDGAESTPLGGNCIPIVNKENPIG